MQANSPYRANIKPPFEMVVGDFEAIAAAKIIEMPRSELLQLFDILYEEDLK